MELLATWPITSSVKKAPRRSHESPNKDKGSSVVNSPVTRADTTPGNYCVLLTVLGEVPTARVQLRRVGGRLLQVLALCKYSTVLTLQIQYSSSEKTQFFKIN